ncbi:prephenate dehydrogenase [Halalkalibacterium halodurans]|uniref:Prephenate dehydrogenase n=1 Tax=Halalkalibacterium halodurans (strain ATCC BAA-125 / DSM 18197 / FERM 7344 / JCM 9153 / C-125) TaxID=272558 RepID=Q9KCA7_HALH5|nr:prephenate dehydrogenase [Halalkalibacterium halodurans]MDY7222237.1 prephenate dehydrogenase [Halalkalibacterium halodurans]MDY7241458.1 prephenate dehydrogenase [Halalkalibacterium halodurans]MED4081357.1 prephenate dehydrogenase [Halalkalibacterium halodurans]MED4086896.1 prephenate dehydrogenase [Halalkalibacterium halodurans]MED4104329.1 prephenate dehydrogenase [Halalkalibacterium halodurans]
MAERTVFIIGLGLIGGSIALAIRKEHDVKMIGFDVNEHQVKMALSLGVIDEEASTMEEGASQADLIVLATPVARTTGILQQLAKLPLKADAIVTDVGSTKKEIMEEAQFLEEKGITFIGGHPMAGSHKSGVEAARAHLFENAFYILTPSKELTVKPIIQLQNWLKGTKAKFIEMTPDQHDRLVGAISHFPHIVAASLVHQVAKIESEDPMVSRLAAGGFRDITRIASGSPIMWRDILLHNKDSLLQLLETWEREMEFVKQVIEEEDEEKILQYFHEAKVFRDGLPIHKKGAIPSFYDLYVDVPDHPGVISDVTRILANEKISITNIRILETREDIMGVLRLSFRSEEDREQAKRVLQAEMYETYLM